MAHKSSDDHHSRVLKPVSPATPGLADRINIGFSCPNSHIFEVTFAAEADLPTQWDCPKCGQAAQRSDGTAHITKPEKPTRTHWDMMRERRSISELEEILADHLDDLRRSD